MEIAHTSNGLRESLRLAGHEDLALTIPKIELFLTEWWAHGSILYWFTDHGPDHSRRVADLAHQIADIPTLPESVRLSPLESYVLWAASILHDLGMQSLLGNPAGTQNQRAYEQIRHEHPNESRNVINSNSERIGLLDDLELVGAIAYVARAHGTKYYHDSMKILDGADQLHGEPVRTRLLASILLMADELDLDVRRAVAPPAGQPLGLLSQAHLAKHRIVRSQAVEHRAQGRVRFHIHISANGCPEVQAAVIEKWIVEKLRIQMALVEPAFTAGFAGHAELDRNIRVTHHQTLVPPNPLPAAVLKIIEDEVTANELIDHERTSREVDQVLYRHGVAVITGRILDFEDVDGREDIAAAALARHRGRMGSTISSRALYETDGAASLQDILRELCFEEGVDLSKVENRSESLLQALLTSLTVSVRDTVVWISCIDKLAPDELDWVKASLLPRIHELSHVSLLFTAEPDTSLCGTSHVETILSYGMEVEEVQAYLSRYVSGRPSRVEALQKLRYSRYKRMRQDYVADMMAGV